MKKTIFCLTFLIMALSCAISNAQVGIGTVIPASGSILDIESTDKGVLIPRVALTGTNDITTITPAATKGLLVFNTATVISGITSVSEGFYYWNDIVWVPVSVNNADWKLIGNDDVEDGNHFLGTTNTSNLDFRTFNIERFRISGNTDQVQAMSNGTRTAPFYSWETDPNVGMWRPGIDQLALGAGSVEFIRLREAAINELVINERAAVVNTRIESQNDINMLFVDGSTNRIGVKTNSPQATLHIAGANNSIRVDELNSSNIHNLGTEPAPVYVNSDGELTLQPTLIMSKFVIDNTTFLPSWGVTVSSSTGAAINTILESTTITLTQESLVHFSYHFSVDITRTNGEAILDGAPRLYRSWVEVNGSTELAYSSGAFINSNTSGGNWAPNYAYGYYYLSGSGYIQLPAGTHNIILRTLCAGGSFEYRIRFGRAGKNLFQAVVHK